jgi:DNA-binding CsgD family transcriptional regulator
LCFHLTPRELEVLALLAEGASNKVIARRLGISVHTAKFHVASLLDKPDAVGRTDAVAHAARRGEATETPPLAASLRDAADVRARHAVAILPSR